MAHTSQFTWYYCHIWILFLAHNNLYCFLWSQLSVEFTHSKSHPLSYSSFLPVCLSIQLGLFSSPWRTLFSFFFLQSTDSELFQFLIFEIIPYCYLEEAMVTHSNTLAWKSHGPRSLVGCSPWGQEESDMTERLHFHFSLSCTGEGNGSPLQCSCPKNPRDGGAWWAAVYRVAQSRTRLTWLSSSSSSLPLFLYGVYF